MAPGRARLKPEELRKLMKEYDINFEGVLPPSEWPVQYAELFRKIYDIKHLAYEEYKPSERRTILAVAEMKDRVAKLNRISRSCLDQDGNEATWRGLTEHQIVSRFDEEVKWWVTLAFSAIPAVCEIIVTLKSRLCDKRLWDSEFKALPHDPIEARMLQERRARRTFCCCSLQDKAMENV